MKTWLSLVAAAPLFLAACGEGPCSLADCPRVERRIELSLACRTKEPLTVTACLNDRCASGTLECQTDEELSERPPGFLKGDRNLVHAVAVEPYAATDGGVPDVTLVYVQFFSKDGKYDGDRYSVRVSKARTDETLATWERRVFYESTYPSGGDCGECLKPIDVLEGGSFSARRLSAPPSIGDAPAAKCRK
jgi:hypothetical protein